MSASARICSKCNTEKSLESFYRSKTGRYGRTARCKECMKAEMKALQGRTKEVLSEKRCGHCKSVKPTTSFHKNSAAKDGLHANCKKCKNRHRWTPNGKFGAYQRSAAQRGHAFKLTLEEFSAFWQKPCEYCGSEIETIALDRIDPSKGYFVSNIKSCCKICNYMKRKMSFDEWVTHMKKVLSFNKINGDEK